MRKHFDYVLLSAEQASNALGDAIALSWDISDFDLLQMTKYVSYFF